MKVRGVRWYLSVTYTKIIDIGKFPALVIDLFTASRCLGAASRDLIDLYVELF
jgi:hypothetical protein